MKKIASFMLIIAAAVSCGKKDNAVKEINTADITKTADSLQEEKTALVIIDVQNDYFPGGAMELVNAEKAAMKTKEMLSYFRKNKMAVIHVQHIAMQKGATFFLPDTEGAEINQMVSPIPGEKIIVKNYPNSFRETNLLAFLQQNNITNLIFSGMMTDVCVDATVRAAMDNGFKNTVISDAVATKDRDLNGMPVPAAQINTSYLAGLNALDGLYAQVISSEEFLAAKH